jgi:hypothetical protein
MGCRKIALQIFDFACLGRKYFYPRGLREAQILFGIFPASQRHCAPEDGNYLQKAVSLFLRSKSLKF